MFHFSLQGIRSFLQTSLKNVRAPYRLAIFNQQSGQEVMRFNLTKRGVYIFFSSIFVGLFLLFSLLIFFTPLKYYVPGNQQSISRTEMIKVKRVADSVLKRNQAQEKFIANLLAVTRGDQEVLMDTNSLSPAELQRASEALNQQVDKATNYDHLKKRAAVAADSLPAAE